MKTYLSFVLMACVTAFGLSAVQSRLKRLEREQERLWHKITVVNTVNSGTGELKLYIGKVPIGTISNDVFLPVKPLDSSQTNSPWAGWSIAFSNGVDGPAFVSQMSKDGTRIIRTLPVLHEPKKKE